MRRIRWISSLLLSLSVAAACGDDERIRPAAPVGTDAGAKPGVALPDAGGTPPVTPKRVVFERNPFGNVKASDNLLWDGDFEWATTFAEQYGWVNAAQLVTVGAFDQVRVGTECRSGMKCGYLGQNQKIAGVGVSPGSSKVSASVWIKVPDCSSMLVALIACDYGVDPDVLLTDADSSPDEDGWCHYEAVSEPRQRASCLLVGAELTEGEALVDDAVVRAAGAAAPPSSRFASAAQKAVIDQARIAIRKNVAPRPPRRQAIDDALERWSRRAR